MTSPRDTFAFWRSQELFAFRKGPWKVHFITRGVYGRGPARVVHEVPELYNLGNDPGERWNVAASNPDVIRELTALADAHRAGVPLVSRSSSVSFRSSLNPRVVQTPTTAFLGGLAAS